MGKSAACRKGKAKKRAQRRAAQNAGGSVENVDHSPGNDPLGELVSEAEKMDASSGTRLAKENEAVASLSFSNLGAGKEAVESQRNNNQFSWTRLNSRYEKLGIGKWARERAPTGSAGFFPDPRQGPEKFNDHWSSESRVQSTVVRRQRAGCNKNRSDNNVTFSICSYFTNDYIPKVFFDDGMSHIHFSHLIGVTHLEGPHQHGSLSKVVFLSDRESHQQNDASNSKSPGPVGTSDKKEKEVEAPMPQPIPEVAALTPSTNRWVPKSRIKKEAAKLAPDGTILLSEEDVKQKTKSALNKVTLESMGPISEILSKICRQSLWEEDAKTLKLVLQLVLAKAYDEPYWSSVYANLCARIINDISPDIKDKSTLKNGAHESGGQLARRILLSGCQSDYSKESTILKTGDEDLQPAQLAMLSDEYYAAKAKQRKGQGLIKLIGNLYKINILGVSVVIHCLRDLLDCTTVCLESSLAILAELIQIVGPLSDADETLKASMYKVFHQLDILLEKNQMVSKSRYTLMDLQEQRANNWMRKVETAKTNTIKQIRDEADTKKQATSDNHHGESHNQQKSGSSVNDPRSPKRAGSGLGTAVWADKPAMSSNQAKREDHRADSHNQQKSGSSVNDPRSPKRANSGLGTAVWADKPAMSSNQAKREDHRADSHNQQKSGSSVNDPRSPKRANSGLGTAVWADKPAMSSNQAKREDHRADSHNQQKSGSSVNDPRSPKRAGSGLGTAVWADKPAMSSNQAKREDHRADSHNQQKSGSSVNDPRSPKRAGSGLGTAVWADKPASSSNQAKREDHRGKSQNQQKSISSVNGPRAPKRGGSGLGTAVWADKPTTSSNQAERGNHRGESQNQQKSSSSVNGPRVPKRGGSGLGTAVWADKPATSFNK